MRFELHRARLAAGVFTLLFVGACGGTAIVDPGGSGGTGGAGAAGGNGGSGATGTGATTSTTTSTSTGMLEGLCVPACESLKECGGGFNGCVEMCEQRQLGPCGDLHQTWLSCGLGETNTMCGFGAGAICAPQLEAWLDCSGIVAGELGCAGGPNACSCSVFVSPGVELTQSCADGNCECLFGGEMSIGFCPDPTFECDPIFNCCAGLFYTGGI